MTELLNASPATVILAAGQGTRMKSATPKVLHEIAGLPMLAHVMRAASALTPARQTLVVSANGARISDAARLWDEATEVAVQDPPKGTGDAVRVAMPHLEGFEGVVLILYGDTPLITSETLARLCRACEGGAGAAVLGFRPDDPGAYGRLVADADGRLERIVEAKDASPEELAIPVCNSGVMAADAALLREVLPQLSNDNAKGEYYLTDVIGLARDAGRTCAMLEAAPDEVLGVNSRSELAVAERVYQGRAREHAMVSGVTLTAPETVYFAHDTELGRDVVVHPHVVFGPGVVVEEDAEIKAFSHLEGARVRKGAVVGPYARLRPAADIGEGAKVGNFVEIKKADIGPGAKVNHLTYIGDATIGGEANIGAGTITCNYDGYGKHKTEIGAGAFIGSNSALVAPVKIEDGAYVGSGSVITKDVTSGALALSRTRQQEIPGWADRFRSRKSK